VATLHFHVSTTSTPEQFVAAVTDFGPDRERIFARSAHHYLEVHSRGATEADVTEGSSGVWERLHYDWSGPDRIVMWTTDSNAWGHDSGHMYTLRRRPDGTTGVDAVMVRKGKNLRGWLLETLVGTIGRGSLAKAFADTVEAIEARNRPQGAGEESDAS